MRRPDEAITKMREFAETTGTEDELICGWIDYLEATRLFKPSCEAKELETSREAVFKTECELLREMVGIQNRTIGILETPFKATYELIKD